jgi:SPW repeat
MRTTTRNTSVRPRRSTTGVGPEGSPGVWDYTPEPLADRPSEPPPGGEDQIVASTLNLFAGIWLIIAPWVLGYGTPAARWNDVACGAAVGILALGRASGIRTVWPSVANFAIGIWLLIASFTIDTTHTEWVNDIVLGSVVALFALWSAASRGKGRTALAGHRSQVATPGPARAGFPLDRRAPHPPAPRGRTSVR